MQKDFFLAAFLANAARHASNAARYLSNITTPL